MKFTKVLVMAGVLALAGGGTWLTLQTLRPEEGVSRAPNTSQNYAEQQIWNMTYDNTNGGIQAINVSRGATSPNTSQNYATQSILNRSYDSTNGALQIVLSENSSDIPFINTTSLTDGDLLKYDATGEEWINTQGALTVTDANRLKLKQENSPAAPTLTFGDGDTGIYESVDDTLNMAIAGVQAFILAATKVAVGQYAGQNAGASSNNVGYIAGQNTGISSNNFGHYAGQNTGNYSNNVGQSAGQNAGVASNNIGQYAGRYAGDYSNNVGNYTGRYAGDYSNHIGALAGQFGATHNNAFGYSAGRYMQGSDNIAIGDAAWSTFLTDAGSAKTFDYTDIIVADDDITITGHGFGSTNEYINITYTQGTGAIGGLTNGAVYQIKIIDANTISMNEKEITITSAGTGTGHTFTPQSTYTNSICIGADTVPSASNQTTLGNATTTETILAGQVSIDDGLVPAHKTADPCGSGFPEGAIFWNATSHYLCVCDGTNDVQVSDGTSACF
jgi:hypothetical protein